jgi:hypothetical protein
MIRRRALTRDQPLELYVVVDVSVLRRQIADHSVMREQLRYIAEMSELSRKRTARYCGADWIKCHPVRRRRQNWSICAQIRHGIAWASTVNIRRSVIVRANYNVPACRARRPRGALTEPVVAHLDRGQ